MMTLIILYYAWLCVSERSAPWLTRKNKKKLCHLDTPRPAAETRGITEHFTGPKTLRSAGRNWCEPLTSVDNNVAALQQRKKHHKPKLVFSDSGSIGYIGSQHSISGSFLAVSHPKPPCLCKWLANVCAMAVSMSAGQNCQPLLTTLSQGCQLKTSIQHLGQTWGGGRVYHSQLVSDAFSMRGSISILE